jgi:hypothetical protein
MIIRLEAGAFNFLRNRLFKHLKELDRNVGETEVDQTDANPGTDYKDILV